MDVLTFTTLYPNAAQPQHGVFVENRMRHLLARRNHRLRVVAPVPWFPSDDPRFGRYATFARCPALERRHGVAVAHPRFPVIPKVGMALAPWLMYRAVRPLVQRLGRRAVLIDAHYFYPDGVAAALLARDLGLPLVITGRGSDLHHIPEHPLPRRMIQWAAAQAQALVTVCAALKDSLVSLGVPEHKVHVLRNGVDLDAFRPEHPADARARLGLQGDAPVVAAVGRLIPLKGLDLVIGALSRLPEVRLAIAGDGPERGALEQQARALGVAERVHFLGRVPHEDLRHLYSAADALVLASEREGWPNVLLESMACGTPVAATAVWGIPEVVAAPEAGRLITDRSVDGVADTLGALLAAPPPRPAVRAYAERFGWDDTARGLEDLFADVAERGIR